METHAWTRTVDSLDHGTWLPRWVKGALGTRRPAANCLPVPALHALAQGAVLPLKPGRCGATLVAHQGSLVVTQEGDLDDHVLGPGEVFHATGRGLLVVWALSDAHVSVAHAAPRPLAA